MKEGLPAIVLETSAAIAYLGSEPEWPDVEGLVQLAEQERVVLFMSDFAWNEIRPHRTHDKHRLNRLKKTARIIPKVARLGEWLLGEDALGHDSSHEIEASLAPPVGRSRPDVEQFLSYCAQLDADFFVTTDGGFLKDNAKAQVHDRFGFRVGRPADCVEWLRDRNLL